MTDRLLTVPEVAELLRVRVSTFRKSSFRRRLDSVGFPAPRLRGRWSSAAIADWMAAASQAEQAALPADPVERSGAAIDRMLANMANPTA